MQCSEIAIGLEVIQLALITRCLFGMVLSEFNYNLILINNKISEYVLRCALYIRFLNNTIRFKSTQLRLDIQYTIKLSKMPKKAEREVSKVINFNKENIFMNVS